MPLNRTLTRFSATVGLHLCRSVHLLRQITFNTTTLYEQQADPKATTNFRTPRYDLDDVYGRGPRPSP